MALLISFTYHRESPRAGAAVVARPLLSLGAPGFSPVTTNKIETFPAGGQRPRL
jgi:hypothetical protein